MIQRQQTLWLLLAGVAAFLTFQYPFYTGTILKANSSVKEDLDAASHLGLLLITAVLILIALIAIFLFKDRKTQLRTTIVGLVLSIILIVLYFSRVSNYETGGHFTLTCIFAILIPASFLLAARGIYKDKKLIKSLDKLR
jgi:glucan phosphoethanolaminetransferase (alkaline phosphatase superfamily)